MYLRRELTTAICAIGLALTGSAIAASSASAVCAGQTDFSCGSLAVPLDREGRVAGTVGLRYAVQPQGPGTPKRLLIFLSGGPGQPSVASVGSIAISLEPLLRKYRLAVLDQRGTGASGVLRCPQLQRTRGLDPIGAGDLEACAHAIGARRDFYASADSVLDIEALRKRLGANRVALMGISYGTYVAIQYARAFPARVDRLILDSVVGPDRPDGFLLDSFGALPRILTEACARGGCRGITADPVGDVAAVAAELARGPIRAAVYDARGLRRTAALLSGEDLLAILDAGDLNPFLQSALPAAVAAARAGDPAPLLRLRAAVQGTPVSATDLSFGVLVATGCADAAMPYGIDTPLADRPALSAAAFAALDPARYAPFDLGSVRSSSSVTDCQRWPVGRVRQPFTGPLPNVPTLLLSGKLDIRTPMENAIATKAQLPRATLVAVRGTGHDVTDSDTTGCAARALARFAAGVPVGQPCAGRDNGVTPLPIPPTSLADLSAPPSTPGARGRALAAAAETVGDAWMASLISLYAGVDTRGGGLRGGRFVATFGSQARVTLHRYAYVPGLRLTGTVRTTNGRALLGTVRIEGRGVAGQLTFTRRGISGVLGGRHVRLRGTSAMAALASDRSASTLWSLARRSLRLLER